MGKMVLPAWHLRAGCARSWRRSTVCGRAREALSAPRRRLSTAPVSGSAGFQEEYFSKCEWDPKGARPKGGLVPPPATVGIYQPPRALRVTAKHLHRPSALFQTHLRTLRHVIAEHLVGIYPRPPTNPASIRVVGPDLPSRWGARSRRRLEPLSTSALVEVETAVASVDDA
jgi:hypothetical protein